MISAYDQQMQLNRKAVEEHKRAVDAHPDPEVRAKSRKVQDEFQVSLSMIPVPKKLSLPFLPPPWKCSRILCLLVGVAQSHRRRLAGRI